MKSIYKAGQNRLPLQIASKPLLRCRTLHPARRFHASAPRSLDHPTSSVIVDTALQLSHSVFQEVHSISHLPWAISIPLVAVLFRLAFIPVQYIINRRQQNLALYLPVTVAWRGSFYRQAMIKFPNNIPGSKERADQWVDQQMKQQSMAFGNKIESKRIGNFMLGLSFLPIWIVNMDVMRRMTGLDKTLLGIITGTSRNMTTSIVPPEPSLALEGMLWFSDLTASDPTGILPLSFGAAMISNWWIAMGKQSVAMKQVLGPMGETKVKLTMVQQQRLQERLVSNVIFLLSFLAAPVLIMNEAPSGLCLYLVASSATMLAVRPMLKTLMRTKQMTKTPIPLLPKMRSQDLLGGKRP